MMKVNRFFQWIGVIALTAGLTFLIQGYSVSTNTSATHVGDDNSISGISTLSDEGMIGEIRLFAGNFAPRGWAFCDGQLLAVSSNAALFSILGTTYGGDGRTTFALPDLRGRVPLHPGRGPGLQSYTLGQQAGNEIIRGVPIPGGQQNPKSKSFALATAKNDNRQPSLAINYIICLQGLYPSRS
jgi:microcystin-dependent protein